MKKKLNVTYFALSEKFGDKHAGFTHSFNVTKYLGSLCKLDVFFLSDKLGSLEKINNTEYHGVIFPSSRNILKLFAFLRSYIYVKKIIKYTDVVNERFHVNPIDLLFVGKKPYILEINDPAMVLHKNPIYSFLINLKLKRCKCIITQTQTLKNILSRYTSKPIYVVSNGVNTAEFRPNIKSNVRNLYNIKKNEILVIFVGGFMQWHGVNDVITLAKTFPKVKFLMIGKGPEFNNVVRESGGVDNLIITGALPNQEIPRFLAAADIVIAPFDTKKFNKLDKYGFWWCPVKLFEYMASGKPVVSYNYFEVMNIVKDAGLLANTGDLKDFINKLKRLIDNKNLRLRLGKKSRELALNYDWKYRATEISKIYEKCLKK